MRKLVKKLEETITKGQPVVLCSISLSHGSCPRGEGAMMLVTEEGRIAGTIGGGAVEYNAQKKAAEVLRTGKSSTHEYILRNNDIQDIGMICGGDVEVDFFYMDPEAPETLAKLEELQEAVKRLANVYIFGGGHVAQALVPLLTSVDFNCIVIEDRKEFAEPSLFPGVDRTILCDNNEHIADYVEFTEDDYICIMTRGHKDDMIIEAQAVKTPAKYIGVIGSREKIAAVSAQLRERGCTEEEIARITSPIGIPVRGARTPEEISVCIAAELIEVRAGFGVREK